MNNYYRLNEVCKVKGGKRIPAGETLQVQKNNHPYIRIVDMYQGRIIEENDNTLYAKDSYQNKIKNYTVNSGDVILAIVGNTLGMVSIIGESLDGANLTENCCKFVEIDNTKVLPMFLYYSLTSPLNQKTINKFKVGSSQPKLPIYNINNLLIPKIDLDKQKHIIDILSKIDKLIENNKKVNLEIERNVDVLYNKWFFEYNYPNSNNLPYKESNGIMVWNSSLSKEIPLDWEVVFTKNRFEYKSGVEPGSNNYLDNKSTNSTPFYRVGDLNTTCETYVNKDFLKQASVTYNDVLVSFDGTVGRIGLGISGAYSTGLRKIFDKQKEINNCVIWALFRSEYFQKTINKYATGSNILHASRAIDYLNFAYNKKTFDKFSNIIQPMYNMYVNNIRMIENLNNLRNYIQPLLMANVIS